MNTDQGTRWIVLEEAHDALRDVVAGAAGRDWDAPSPCEGWTVTQVLQHAAGDQLGFASIITGEPGPTENPFDPSGVLDGLAARGARADPAGRGPRAWSTVAPDADDAPTPLPQGAMAAPVAVGACALDAAVHAWDIAVATGQPSPLTADLAAHPARRRARRSSSRSAYGAYAPAIEVDGDTDPVTALLAYLGRRADWTV